MDSNKSLAGKRILVVEDEYFIADDVARDFQRNGAEVAGPAPSVDDALALLTESDRLDGAVLDINLRGEMVFPVADALMERGVPFLFVTGYDGAVIPPRYAEVRRCEKPVEPNTIARVLFA